ncbi:Hypothetical_protein [Hexamita inflata]|uniref:Hypothetical_protein n=1 Tax=Hexamita inflata TaxID=28002 RepID=A0AA86QCV8_9EUKA|nr:Hypothetical protein HINF_LOCUS44599 [Hexamita inflata]
MLCILYYTIALNIVTFDPALQIIPEILNPKEINISCELYIFKSHQIHIKAAQFTQNTSDIFIIESSSYQLSKIPKRAKLQLLFTSAKIFDYCTIFVLIKMWKFLFVYTIDNQFPILILFNEFTFLQQLYNDQAWRFDVRAEEALLKYQLCLV